MDEFLSVKDAILLVNKSHTTLYRLCQKFNDTPYIKKEDGKFLINKDFLLAKYPVVELKDEPFELSDTEGITVDDSETNYEEVLQQEMEVKDETDTNYEKVLQQEMTETQTNEETAKETIEEEIEEPETLPSVNESIWETVIGVGLGSVLIVAFIWFLYANGSVA